MLDIRCECGKIVCQSEHEFVVIKCRHCKRFVFIKAEDNKISISPHVISRANDAHRHYIKTM